MIEWLQSIEGILTLSIGGLSLGAIATNVITAVKNIGRNKEVSNLKDAVLESKKALEDSTLSNKQLNEDVKDKELELQKLELSKAQENETQKLILKSLTYIVSAAGGIDDVTKIQLITDMNNAQNKIKEEYDKLKELSIKKAEELKTVIEDKKEEVLEKAAETAITFLDDAKEKVNTLVNKYSRK